MIYRRWRYDIRLAPYDILASQAWYNIRSFICRRHISSTEGGYHIEDISSVSQGTDIIENTLIVSQWGCFHGAEGGIRTLVWFPTNWFRVSPVMTASIPLHIYWILAIYHFLHWNAYKRREAHYITKKVLLQHFFENSLIFSLCACRNLLDLNFLICYINNSKCFLISY